MLDSDTKKARMDEANAGLPPWDCIEDINPNQNLSLKGVSAGEGGELCQNVTTFPNALDKQNILEKQS